MSSERSAYLFLTDKEAACVLQAFAGIREAVSPRDKTYILFHQKNPVLSPPFGTEPVYCFTYDSLIDLHYLPIAMNIIPGSNHFPVLQFFRDFSEFQYYWVIEDDVRFTGSWKYFFDFFDRYEHDLISSHLRSYREEPDWNWWDSLAHEQYSLPLEHRIRSFNPIYRISGRALGYIDAALSDGWMGHHEVLLPSLLYHRQFSLLDFGGEGRFVPAGNKNSFYTSCRWDLCDGTMRYRPVWQAVGSEKNKLYHPVKPFFQ